MMNYLVIKSDNLLRIAIGEEIKIKTETQYDKLPSHVSERLGMSNNMKNVLVQITLRALDRTLTKDETNSIIKDLYLNIHEGSRGYY